jgi:hypothetical protein
MLFERPHNAMVENMQPSQAYVFGPTPAPVQPVAPMFAAPPVGQVANAMFKPVQMRNALISEPTPAPVQLTDTTVNTPAVGRNANTDQENYRHPMSEEEERRMRDYLMELFYAPLKRLFDREKAQRRARAEADGQRLPDNLDQETAKRTQQGMSPHELSARPIEDLVPKEPSGHRAASLPGRSAAPNVVGWGDEIPMAPDARHTMSLAAFGDYVPTARDARPETQPAAQYFRTPPNEPAMPAASPNDVVMNQDAGQEPQVAFNHSPLFSNVRLDHVPGFLPIDEFENPLLPRFGFENIEWHQAPASEPTMRPLFPNNVAMNQDAVQYPQDILKLFIDSSNSGVEEMLAQAKRNKLGDIDWNAEFPDMP